MKRLLATIFTALVGIILIPTLCVGQSTSENQAKDKVDYAVSPPAQHDSKVGQVSTEKVEAKAKLTPVVNDRRTQRNVVEQKAEVTKQRLNVTSSLLDENGTVIQNRNPK